MHKFHKLLLRILGSADRGSLFIEGNLTADLYLNILQKTKDSLITTTVNNLIDVQDNLVSFSYY